MRLIDADEASDALTERWNRTIDYHGIGEDIAEECKVCLNAVPTIDAVPKEKILLFLNIANEELSKAHADKNMNGIVTWSVSVTTLEGLLKKYDTADTDIIPVIRCVECYFWDKEPSQTAMPEVHTCRFWRIGTTCVDYCARASRDGWLKAMSGDRKDIDEEIERAWEYAETD